MIWFNLPVSRSVPWPLFDGSPQAQCLLCCLLKSEFSFFKKDFDLIFCFTSFEATPASPPTGTERAAWEVDYCPADGYTSWAAGSSLTSGQLLFVDFFGDRGFFSPICNDLEAILHFFSNHYLSNSIGSFLLGNNTFDGVSFAVHCCYYLLDVVTRGVMTITENVFESETHPRGRTWDLLQAVECCNITVCSLT